MVKLSRFAFSLMVCLSLCLTVACKKDEDEAYDETPATTAMETTMEPMVTDMGTTDMGTDMTPMTTDATTPPAGQ